MANYIGNALSLGMIDLTAYTIRAEQISLESACEWVRTRTWDSCVGHADTAVILTGMLGIPVKMNRCSTSLQPGDQILVAQYNGPRLPEGATSLPEGAKIRWILAKVSKAAYVYLEGDMIGFADQPPADGRDSFRI